MKPICVSVIIPAYNASATIGQTLEALSRQNCFQPYEVIVVDDGSTDNTADIVKTFTLPGSVKVKYIHQDNSGPAAARNHGARLAEGEFLAFTDSDCIPHEDWISRLMAGFSSGYIGVVAGSYGIANPQSRLSRCIHAEIRWRHTHLMPEFTNAFGSYNFCVKREVFEAVGGFDPSYRFASGEDNDLSYKIRHAGWRIFFDGSAQVNHYHTTGVARYLKEQFRHGFWRVKMYLDHPRMVKGDGYTYWKDIIEIPLAFCLSVLLLFWVGGSCHVGHVGDSPHNGDIPWGVPIMGTVPFLVFEMVSAVFVVKSFFDGIFFGFVLTSRAFARLFGFSTGILAFLFRK